MARRLFYSTSAFAHCRRQRAKMGGRARPLCPDTSDVDLFGNCERVIDLDSEIANRALDFGMAKQ